uniref:GIY-YIG domain-containing protein n=1 Tax=viral metagenome TaxID=1070528 RepID=A0A6H1ZT14_9ZZZZ
MATPEIHWSGASGQKYGYLSQKLPYSCDVGQNGNYIFAKIVNNAWVPIYIGQGDIDDRVNDPTHYKCSTGKGATHVHVHLTSNEADRITEEQDLLKGHPSAYAPTGCNEKTWG